jgi:SAM-dependent methyltransferase
MVEMWNERYGKEEYAYGKGPNLFFKKSIDRMESSDGHMLLPAEGEGRNAVYASRQGWQVEAFDTSIEGRNKAMRLAKEENTSINYTVGDLEQQSYKDESFDVIGLVFAHFPPAIRKKYHTRFMELLKPGGRIVMEVFATGHLAYNSKNPKAGGPKTLDMLYTTDIVKENFQGLEIELLEEKLVELNEGLYHIGESSVIRFIGRKKA